MPTAFRVGMPYGSVEQLYVREGHGTHVYLVCRKAILH
jgi:hypothetical protein